MKADTVVNKIIRADNVWLVYDVKIQLKSTPLLASLVPFYPLSEL